MASQSARPAGAHIPAVPYPMRHSGGNVFEGIATNTPRARWAMPELLGPSFFTPGQKAFRNAARGFDADAAQYGDRAGHHPIQMFTYNNYDGTSTVQPMEATESGWFLTDGDTGRVTGAGRY